MSAPVDVRAVIRAVIEELRATGNTGHVQNLLDADVAVVELIEADRDFDAAELELGNAKYGPYTKRLSRYTAAEKRRSLAVARVGGAS
jgi:hypothetical protein